MPNRFNFLFVSTSLRVAIFQFREPFFVTTSSNLVSEYWKYWKESIRLLVSKIFFRHRVVRKAKTIVSFCYILLRSGEGSSHFFVEKK